MTAPQAATNEPHPAIEVSGLHRDYGTRRALRGLDLRVERGEFIVVFGPNGAGKSTLIRILSRLTRPSRGTAAILGSTVDSADFAPSRIGLMGHRSFLYNGMTARENLLFYGRMYGLPDPMQRATELLEELQLADRGDDLVRTFSRGMAQRLSVARALVQDPDLLLLDEPFTGLDPVASELLAGLLARTHQRGRTVLLTTHDLALGHRLCSRFVLLVRGRVAFESDPGRTPAHELEAVYRGQVAESA